MHSVKYAKWKPHIHNSSPHVEIVEFSFRIMVKLGASAKRGQDP